MSNGSARHRVVLVVLDGWGYRVEREGNAIELASTPVWHRLWESYPRTLLDASGLAVGLPKGRWATARWGTSTSAPGGWWRRISSGSPRASRAGSSTSCRRSSSCALRCARAAVRSTWSDSWGPAGCTRSTGTCWRASSWARGSACRRSRSTAFSTAATPPRHWGQRWSGRCSSTCAGSQGREVDIASLTGRYFGMDRDRRWDRTRLAYDAIVHGIGTPVEHPVLAVQAAYQRGETDEFIRPLVHHRGGARWPPYATATACCSSIIAATGCARSCAAVAVEGFSELRPRPAAVAVLRHHDAV